MFLLNSTMVHRHMEHGDLKIDPFNPVCLQHNHYRCTLAGAYRSWNNKGNRFDEEIVSDSILIEPGGYLLVRSLELFTFGDSLYAELSQTSEMALEGLRLNHSFSIDPHFKGHLWMGLQNILSRECRLNVGAAVAKIVFFNVAESKIIRNSLNADLIRKYEERSGEGLPHPPGALIG